MSQPVSKYLHPFDVHRPSFEPEVERAIMASWSLESSAVQSRPALLNLSKIGNVAGTGRFARYPGLPAESGPPR